MVVTATEGGKSMRVIGAFWLSVETEAGGTDERGEGFLFNLVLSNKEMCDTI